MYKAMNTRGYTFGCDGIRFGVNGFGIVDESTGEWFSLDGKAPYILKTKKLVQGIIDVGNTLRWRRVKPIGTPLFPYTVNVVR